MKFFIDVWTASDDSLPEVIMLRNMAAYRFQNSLLSENQINDVQEWVGEQFSRLLLEEKTTLSMRSDITIINFDDCAPEGRILAFFFWKGNDIVDFFRIEAKQVSFDFTKSDKINEP